MATLLFSCPQESANKDRGSGSLPRVLKLACDRDTQLCVSFLPTYLRTQAELQAIDLQPKVMQAIINAKGGPTSYMNSGFAKS